MDGWLAVEVKELEARYCPNCPAKHQLSEFVSRRPHNCDLCSEAIPPLTETHGCRNRHFDLCEKCISLPQSRISSGEKESGPGKRELFHRFHAGKHLPSQAAAANEHRALELPEHQRAFHRWDVGHPARLRGGIVGGGDSLGASSASPPVFAGKGNTLGTSTEQSDSASTAAPVQSESASIVIDAER